jgi:hypothetical protein
VRVDLRPLCSDVGAQLGDEGHDVGVRGGFLESVVDGEEERRGEQPLPSVPPGGVEAPGPSLGVPTRRPGRVGGADTGRPARSVFRMRLG